MRCLKKENSLFLFPVIFPDWKGYSRDQGFDRDPGFDRNTLRDSEKRKIS